MERLADADPKAWADRINKAADQEDEARIFDKPIELRVAKTTNPKDLATSITCNLEERRRVAMLCIGVVAISTGIKAVGIANGWCATHGYFLTVYPAFDSTTINDQERTMMRLIVCRHLPGT